MDVNGEVGRREGESVESQIGGNPAPCIVRIERNVD